MSEDLTLLEHAQFIAQSAHSGQTYGKVGTIPYHKHLEEVVAVAECYGLSEREKICCWLHDVLEDTTITNSDLYDWFGEDVMDIVLAVTDSPGKNRKERKAKTYPRTVMYADAVRVKLCDRIANVSYCVRTKDKKMFSMYYDEHLAFSLGLRLPRSSGVTLEMFQNLSGIFEKHKDNLYTKS